LSSVCAFLICSGELAFAGSTGACEAPGAFCAYRIKRPLASARAGAHSDTAITTDPARQTAPRIVNLICLMSTSDFRA
jgi:hypothetical protein